MTNDAITTKLRQQRAARTITGDSSGDIDAPAMSGRELMDATGAVVRTISRDHDVSVGFGGDRAYTNGRRVNLPSVPDDVSVTRRQALVTGGYANHEALHNIMTDFDKLKKRKHRWAREGKKLLMAMQNAIEDVRIENGGRALYRGLPKSIDQTARSVNRRFIDEVYPNAPEVVSDFRRIGPVAVTWEGRRRLGYPDPSNEEALDLLPRDIRKRVERIVDRALKLETGVRGLGDLDREAALKGSVDGANLATQVVREFEKAEQKQQQQDEGQSQGGEQDEGQDEGQSGGGGESDGDDGGGAEQSQDGDDEQSQGGGAGGDGDEQSEGDGNSSGEAGHDQSGGDEQGGTSGGVGAGAADAESPEPDPVNADLDGAVRTIHDEIMRQAGVESVTGAPHLVFMPSKDEVVRVEPTHEGRDMYLRTKSSMSAQIGTVRRKLERALIAEAESYWENGKRTGKLDVRRNAARLVQLKPNVFRQRRDEPAVNSAVSVLVDMSGSMTLDGSGNGSGKRKIDVATQATVAIAEALESTGVPLEISGHYTVTDGELDAAWGDLLERVSAGDTEADGYRRSLARVEAIRNLVFKGFDEPLRGRRPALGRMSRLADGSNADGDAFRMAAARLLERDEPRKIMLVLSDGAPAYRSELRDQQQYTRDSVAWIAGQGVDIAGLGILTDAPSMFFPDCVVVHDIDEFARVCIEQIGRLLLGRAGGPPPSPHLLPATPGVERR